MVAVFLVGCATGAEKRGGSGEVPAEVIEAHDRVVMLLRSGVEGEEGEEKAVRIFEEGCAEGLAVACTNLGYMRAAGRGGPRDHREALKLFSEHCRETEIKGVGGREEEVFLSEEFDGSQACEQWEVLATGLFEERVISSFQAEDQELGDCYEEAMQEAGMASAGRITLEAMVSADGSGGEPTLIEDRLGLEGVRECLQGVLDRHLEDGVRGEARFRVQWAVSFLHSPNWAAGGEREEPAVVACEPEEVQRGVGEIYPDLKACGEAHLERFPGDPGAVMIRWEVEPEGGVEVVESVSTVESELLPRCLEAVVLEMSLPRFEEGECPVQLPLRFSDGGQLHFSVIRR